MAAGTYRCRSCGALKRHHKTTPPRYCKSCRNGDRQESRRESDATEMRRVVSQNRRLLREVQWVDRIVDEARGAITLLPPIRPPKRPDDAAERSQCGALLLWTDHHIGARFSAAEMGGLNHYDVDEYSRRLRYTVDKTRRIAHERSDIYCPEITVFLGGDLLDGTIHDSLERNADIPPASQVIQGAGLIAQALVDLAGSFERVRVCCAAGNHGRLRKPAEFEAVSQSYDTLLYKMASLLTSRQTNISWSIPQTWWDYAEIEGQGVVLLHGHVGIRGVTGAATFPGWPLARSVSGLLQKMRLRGKPVRHVVLGHFHSFFCVPHEDGYLVINGSMIGGNPYADARAFPHREATQVLMLLHKTQGVSFFPLTPERHEYGLGDGYPWIRDSFATPIDPVEVAS